MFDADRCVHDLLENDKQVGSRVLEAFGESIQEAGKISRPRLRERVFGNIEARQVLEQILHPMVRERWIERAKSARESRFPEYLLVDVPLLYETGAEAHFDRTILVAASEQDQMRRLTELRRLPASMGAQMIAAQMPMDEKIRRAHHVVWNGGSLELLRQQAHLLSSYLKR